MKNDVIRASVAVKEKYSAVQTAFNDFANHAHERRYAAPAGDAHHGFMVDKRIVIKMSLGAGTLQRIAQSNFIQQKIGNEAALQPPDGNVIVPDLIGLGRDAVRPAGTEVIDFQKK